MAIHIPMSFFRVLNEAPCTSSLKFAMVSYAGSPLRDYAVKDVAYKIALRFGKPGAFTCALEAMCL